MTRADTGAAGASLLHGIAVALAASVVGAALLAALEPLIGADGAARAAVATVTLGAALHALASSGELTGRVTTVVVWLALSALAWVGGTPLAVYVLLHVAMLWLARSLYRYSGVLPALEDLALTVLGAALGAWALERSGSAWLALWCFFLVQACTALLPRSLASPTEPRGDADRSAFDRARLNAERALRRLAASR